MRITKCHAMIYFLKKTLFILILSLATQYLQAMILTDMRYNRHQDKVQLVLDIDEPSQFQQFSLPSPPRIVLDFPNSNRLSRANLNVDSGLVKKIRTGYRNADVLRVVIDLRDIATANIYTLTPSDGRGNRVVIDVYDNIANPVLKLESFAGAQMPHVIFSDAPSNHEQIVIAPPRAVTSQKINISAPNVVSTGKKEQQTARNFKKNIKRKNIIVAIDPGHGGVDSGAINKKLDLREKDIVLQISLKLRDAINAKQGFQAVMTRDKDVYIPLHRRMEIARKKNADLFVSIHADSVESSTPSGSSVYILSTHGATSELARQIAKNENQVDLRWGVDVTRYDDDVQQALLNIQQEATLESSQILARQTIKELQKIGKMHKKTVERAAFVVLRSPDIPSMLVETAFISNLQEAQLLATPEYQNKLAAGIANGIELYFDEHLPQHMLLGQFHD